VFDSKKIKLLDNFQLYALTQNNLIDAEIIKMTKAELDSRNISNYEKLRLKQKYELNSKNQQNGNSEEIYSSPLLAGLFLNKNFRKLASLKIQGKKEEVKKLQSKIYIGLFIYFIALIFFIFLVKSK